MNKKKPYRKYPPPVFPGKGGKKTYEPDPKQKQRQRGKKR